ncbi:UDP-3-O-(3-hydroxymyristoyl)glucosamine N-acyltransferase [Leptospira langatensis]|uniref:UDP-3-O-(3-hydroxymyristoyl)glucosamine N-acyltransferase n=1 Tax=Leptospira langatensis TaxID=2484983 RepID=A0A5F1ZXR8_9LEPT|nr:UDP-3-O-acyl-N-acetylglucosamine deacetylase [Leptospira langatensis]TGJ98560.1 UDP-3-O-(3-hydroxymyristoyl)glucosamine N-acyltransferase [Leptospira langatensis]TGL43474.1 UDP-3-O-(3-hydroxymyristoyl)glucosamine N-acyltransferase [Leptospira langatensis]
MQVLTSPSQILDLKQSRNPKILSLPDSFRKETGIDKDSSYTLQKGFTVEGKATFENKPSQVSISPKQNGKSTFSWNGKSYDLDPGKCIKGNHNIQLGEVKVIEHPLAWMLAFGLYADFSLEEASLPTFDYCDRVYMEGAKDNLKEIGKRNPISVSSPFALVWEKGYCIIEPSEDNKFMIDHQVAYPGETIGNSRIEMEFNSEVFSFFGDARTTAFRTKKDAENFYQIGLAGGLKDYPFTLENVLLLDEDKIYNPREKFVHEGYNYEFLCHEIIDIVSWLRFAEEEYEGRFVGRMTTFLFDHHKQIDIAQFVCDREGLQKNGIQVVR